MLVDDYVEKVAVQVKCRAGKLESSFTCYSSDCIRFFAPLPCDCCLAATKKLGGPRSHPRPEDKHYKLLWGMLYRQVTHNTNIFLTQWVNAAVEFMRDELSTPDPDGCLAELCTLLVWAVGVRILHSERTHAFNLSRSEIVHPLEKLCIAAWVGNSEYVEEFQYPTSKRRLSKPMLPSAACSAAYRGHTAVLEHLLCSEDYINVALGQANCCFGEALKHGAVRAGRADVAQLIMRLASPSEIDFSPALYEAAAYGNIEALGILYDKDVDSHKCGTVLWQASRFGQMSVVEYVLSSKNLPMASRDEHIPNALYAACRRGHADVVRRLLYFDPDPTYDPELFRPAILITAFFGYAGVMDILLDAAQSRHPSQSLPEPELRAALQAAHLAKSGLVISRIVKTNQPDSRLNLKRLAANPFFASATRKRIRSHEHCLHRLATRSKRF